MAPSTNPAAAPIDAINPIVPQEEPPPALLDFLKAGPLPVFVGFGSINDQDLAKTARLVLEALDQSGQRGVLLLSEHYPDDLPDDVLMIEPTPFGWLFPRMAAVVHHGGSGTTALGLKAGIPTVVVPSFMDQPFWGQRVADLGVGPPPLPPDWPPDDVTDAELERAKELEKNREVFETTAKDAKALSIPVLTRTQFLNFLGYGGSK